MLMGHPPPIGARGRENASQGCFEDLTPVQVPMVMEELVARNAKVQEALADTSEVVQEIPQAGPHTFHESIPLLAYGSRCEPSPKQETPQSMRQGAPNGPPSGDTSSGTRQRCAPLESVGQLV